MLGLRPRDSASEGELKQILRNASLVVVPSIDAAIRALVTLVHRAS